MAELSEHDQDCLRGVERQLRSQDPDLTDDLEFLSREELLWHPARARAYLGATAFAAAALIALVSLSIAFIP